MKKSYMELIYGTKNPSKLSSMREMLEGLSLQIKGLAELSVKLEEPDESGNDPLHNAELKAMEYYRQLRQPVFSCDSGLYFDDVPDKDQPGVHIKRIHGQNLKEKEFISYYSRLAGKYGGKLTAHYKNSICLVLDESRIYRYDGDEISAEKFYIVDKPHEIYKKGFPLDSLSVHIESSEYYYDLRHTKYSDGKMAGGFRKFFIDSLDLYK